MPSKRSKRGRGGPRDVIPYDFVATFGAASKRVSPDDLGLVTNRAMRPVKASVNAAIVAHSVNPALYLSLYDTKTDIINVSRSVVLGTSTARVSVHAPRGTDFGDYSSSSSPVLDLNLANFYNGSVTVSGTIWFQFAPHKVTTKVSLFGPFPPEDPKNLVPLE